MVNNVNISHISNLLIIHAELPIPWRSRFLFTLAVESPISLFHFVFPSFSTAFFVSRYLPLIQADIAGVTNELADFQ